jgi:hypothetical protein
LNWFVSGSSFFNNYVNFLAGLFNEVPKAILVSEAVSIEVVADTLLNSLSDGLVVIRTGSYYYLRLPLNTESWISLVLD